MIRQNFSSKTYLMAFKFGDGRECESSEREGEREGGEERNREKHVWKKYFMLLVKMWVSNIKCARPNRI